MAASTWVSRVPVIGSLTATAAASAAQASPVDTKPADPKPVDTKTAAAVSMSRATESETQARPQREARVWLEKTAGR